MDCYKTYVRPRATDSDQFWVSSLPFMLIEHVFNKEVFSWMGVWKMKTYKGTLYILPEVLVNRSGRTSRKQVVSRSEVMQKRLWRLLLILQAVPHTYTQ